MKFQRLNFNLIQKKRLNFNDLMLLIEELFY